jgi:endonuclease/exonuclease/phosphatase family metal-dependent hydrolase
MYYGLKYLKKEDRARTIEGLLRLRKQLATELPARSVRDSLMLATWNIRDFGGARLNPSPRLTESLYYMAEIISAFDLVAVQEVNNNMQPFLKMMEILGPTWSYIATDVTEGSGGNGERMAFVYDKGKVLFRNIAGEIVLPKKAQIDNEQFARTPFMVKFQSGWCRFVLNTVHLYYGADAGEKFERRVREIDKIAEFLAGRAETDEENYILLGDMNIVSPNDKTMKALKKHKFVLPGELVKEEIPKAFLVREADSTSSDTTPLAEIEAAADSAGGGSNMNRDKFYDQIAFYSKKNELELGKSKNNAGVFNFYDSVFREADWKSYYDSSTIKPKWGADDAKRKMYFAKKWRTWQMSDHLPLWTELNIDFTEKYLKTIGGL